MREQNLFRTKETPDPEYTEIIELDLNTVVPSLSGPSNPEERVSVPDLPNRLQTHFSEHAKKRGKGKEFLFSYYEFSKILCFIEHFQNFVFA